MSIDATTQLGGGHYLRTDAAKAYLAARLDGCPAGITSSTRSESIQRAYYENQGKPGWPPKADRPDRSKHVWRPRDRSDTGARALDLPEPARAWMHRNGRRYGWYGWRVSGEPWHFEFEPWNSDVALVERVLARGGTIPGVPNLPDLIPITPEDDMRDDERAKLWTAVDALGRIERLLPTLPESVWAHLLTDLADPERKPRTAGSMLEQTRRHATLTLGRVGDTLAAVSALDPADVDPADLAAAIPDNLAGAVADELARRLAG